MVLILLILENLFNCWTTHMNTWWSKEENPTVNGSVWTIFPSKLSYNLELNTKGVTHYKRFMLVPKDSCLYQWFMLILKDLCFVRSILALTHEDNIEEEPALLEKNTCFMFDHQSHKYFLQILEGTNLLNKCIFAAIIY